MTEDEQFKFLADLLAEIKRLNHNFEEFRAMKLKDILGLTEKERACADDGYGSRETTIKFPG